MSRSADEWAALLGEDPMCPGCRRRHSYMGTTAVVVGDGDGWHVLACPCGWRREENPTLDPLLIIKTDESGPSTLADLLSNC